MPPPTVPAVATTPLTKTGPSPDKMTFSAKKRFFEKEIVDSTLPAAKPGKLDELFHYLWYEMMRNNILKKSCSCFVCRETVQLFERR